MTCLEILFHTSSTLIQRQTLKKLSDSVKLADDLGNKLINMHNIYIACYAIFLRIITVLRVYLPRLSPTVFIKSFLKLLYTPVSIRIFCTRKIKHFVIG